MPTLLFSLLTCTIAAEESWTVPSQLDANAIVMSGPTRSPIGEPLSIRLVVTGPPEFEFDEPRFVNVVADGTLVGISSFGPDQTGSFVSRGWMLLIKPQEHGGLSLPDIELSTKGDSATKKQVRLAIPTIAVVDIVAGQWESVSTFFIWAGSAGLLVFLVGAGLTLARSNKSETAG
ncbi:hypothetical protein K2X85_11225 [bacterium]|nr:hypothetical protein [bacterium]